MSDSSFSSSFSSEVTINKPEVLSPIRRFGPADWPPRHLHEVFHLSDAVPEEKFPVGSLPRTPATPGDPRWNALQRTYKTFFTTLLAVIDDKARIVWMKIPLSRGGYLAMNVRSRNHLCIYDWAVLMAIAYGKLEFKLDRNPQDKCYVSTILYPDRFYKEMIFYTARVSREALEALTEDPPRIILDGMSFTRAVLPMAVEFFEIVVKLFQTLPTFAWISNAGITRCYAAVIKLSFSSDEYHLRDPIMSILEPSMYFSGASNTKTVFTEKEAYFDIETT
ncbi:hypothetical protein BDQ17DRAFT_1433291 [Cyathus striatus]|nr:hypothetical protein BDQ17DRAFT_1433291 [Cyathus striatus]